MPTDENNGVTPQNQQVNPTLGDSDDFDFSFDDSNTDQNGGSLSGDMQDQMRRQGRSGMFLTPDEAITKSNNDSDMSLGNIDISSTVQPQQRSGMFLTPDEEAIKEESQIEGKEYSFQGATENQTVDSDDSYLAGIDPGDVEDSQDGSSNDGQQETPIQDNDYSQEKLDDEIEDLISFGDEPKTDNVAQGPVVEQAVVETEQVSQSPEEQTNQPVEEVVEQPVEEVVEQPVESVAEQPVEQNVEPVVQLEQSVESVESNNEEQSTQLDQDVQELQNSQIEQESGGNSGVENTNVESNVVDESKGGDSEDRLSKEDKKVEESFGTAPESVSPDIDVSPESVSQNVESVINESMDTNTQNVEPNIHADVNMDAVEHPIDQTDLHIENMGTDVVENGNGDLISDTGGMEQMEQENSYIPNEAEFNQMSDILNSSSTGQIDLSNLNQEQPSEPVNLSTDCPVDQQEIVIPSVENNPVETDAPVIKDNTIQGELENNVDGELLKYEGVGMQGQVVSQEVQPSQEVQQNVVVEAPSAEINLDSLVQETPPVIQENTQTNDMSNGSLIGTVNEGEAVGQNNQSVQPVQPKKKKKQSGFTVLGIFVGAIALLGLLGFAASKMFPDKFAKFLGKDDVVIEYPLGGNEGNNIDENNPEEVDPDDIENTGDNVEVEQPDPDSLAGLLEGNQDLDGNEDLELSGDVENIEANNGEESGDSALSGDGNDIGEDVVGGDNNTGDFDPFSEIDGLLGEAQEYLDKLNSYLASGQYYVEWGNENNKPGAIKGGEWIVNSAQEQLTELENGGEIDTTLFDRFDQLLSSLARLN